MQYEQLRNLSLFIAFNWPLRDESHAFEYV